ncbi:hypothetical protein VitviT2T_026156 [Vitis vinifera]|uniref:Uncharacterized protein n=1 Tax=Vitis vinifera TaxID=29760 RepID=A0ABY9DPV2_VITVI|nr:hypothetical protein VitviT2T_026156 [Vitis vinifera]
METEVLYMTLYDAYNKSTLDCMHYEELPDGSTHSEDTPPFLLSQRTKKIISREWNLKTPVDQALFLLVVPLRWRIQEQKLMVFESIWNSAIHIEQACKTRYMNML